MKIIRSATCFLGDYRPIAEIEENIERLAFQPLGEEGTYRSGFVSHERTGELITPVFGGYALVLREDEKLLPTAAVNSLINKAIALAEELKGEPLNDAERDEVRSGTYRGIVAKALIQSRTTLVLCHESGLFLVCTSSNAPAQQAATLFRRACGEDTYTLKPLHLSAIQVQLHRLLCQHLDGSDSCFEPFTLGNYCQFAHSGEKVTFDLKQLDHVRAGLDETLSLENMKVQAVELVHEAISFRIGKDSRLKRITFLGELTEEEMEARAELDEAALWRHEAGIQLAQVADVVWALRNLFAVPEQDGEAEEQEAAAV